ncbi:MAG: hypothetical protein Kow0031_32460 [Anaerolineae bacterium]
MATYKIMYWQDIPVQIKVDGDGESVKLQVDDNIMTVVDAAAMKQGLIGSDEYTEQFRWSKKAERPGSAQEVARALQQELAAQLNLGR